MKLELNLTNRQLNRLVYCVNSSIKRWNESKSKWESQLESGESEYTPEQLKRSVFGCDKYIRENQEIINSLETYKKEKQLLTSLYKRMESDCLWCEREIEKIKSEGGTLSPTVEKLEELMNNLNRFIAEHK